MPRVSFFYGIAIYIYYSDHSPPHFHAMYCEYEAVILIQNGELLVGTMPRRALKIVREWCANYKNEPGANWRLARTAELRRYGWASVTERRKWWTFHPCCKDPYSNR